MQRSIGFLGAAVLLLGQASTASAAPVELTDMTGRMIEIETQVSKKTAQDDLEHTHPAIGGKWPGRIDEPDPASEDVQVGSADPLAKHFDLAIGGMEVSGQKPQ